MNHFAIIDVIVTKGIKRLEFTKQRSISQKLITALNLAETGECNSYVIYNVNGQFSVFEILPINYSRKIKFISPDNLIGSNGYIWENETDSIIESIVPQVDCNPIDIIQRSIDSLVYYTGEFESEMLSAEIELDKKIGIYKINVHDVTNDIFNKSYYNKFIRMSKNRKEITFPCQFNRDKLDRADGAAILSISKCGWFIDREYLLNNLPANLPELIEAQLNSEFAILEFIKEILIDSNNVEFFDQLIDSMSATAW